MHNLKFKLFRIFINIIAILYLVFDEVFIYLNDKLTKALDYIPSIDNIREYWSDRFKNMNKYVVLLLLLSHLVVSELLGFLSFMLLAKGLFIPFLALYIFKFLPFFIMSFIFRHSKEQLLTISWFNYCYTKFCDISDYLKRTEIVIKSKEVIQKLKDFKNKIKIL